MPYDGEPDWAQVKLSDLIASLDAGVSVNSEGRQCASGEIGILKTSSVGGGRFKPSEHKVVIPSEMGRVKTPVLGDSIILSRMNTPALVGENGYVEEDNPTLYLPDRLWLLRTNKRADCRWLSYYMQSEFFRSHVDDIATGTSGSMKNISKARLAELSLLLPPLDEQRRIAGVLRAADAYIAAQQALIGKLRNVQWDTMSAFLTSGNDCEQAIEITDWGTGRIPEIHRLPQGWSIVRLTDVAKLESGHTPSRREPSYWEDGDIGWISLHDTQGLENPDIHDSKLMISEQGLKNSSARMLPAGTVCFSRTATVGKCVIMERPMATSQDFANFICSTALNNRYLLYLLRWMQPIWEQLASGSTHQTIYMPTFESLKIIVPSREAQDSLASAMDAMTSSISTETATLEHAINCRSSLAADLLSGRVRVPA